MSARETCQRDGCDAPRTSFTQCEAHFQDSLAEIAEVSAQHGEGAVRDARPFQVGDKVRVIKRHLSQPDEDFTGTVSEFQRITPESPLTMWIDRDEPHSAIVNGEPVTSKLGLVWVTDDRTEVHPLAFQTTIELIEAAPAVARPDQVDSARALNALLDWVNALDEETDPAAYREACDRLADVARDYRESIGGAR